MSGANSTLDEIAKSEDMVPSYATRLFRLMLGCFREPSMDVTPLDRAPRMLSSFGPPMLVRHTLAPSPPEARNAAGLTVMDTEVSTVLSVPHARSS